MSDLTIVGGKVVGVEEFAESITEASKSIGLMKPTPENSPICAKSVTEHNKVLKAAQNTLKEAEKRFLEPFEKQIAPAKEAVEAYASLAKQEQTDVLIAKKEKAKQEAFSLFADLAKLSKDGSLPDWETFYDPSWYSLTSDALRSSMVAKLADFAKKEEPNDPSKTAIITVSGSKNIERVLEFMHDNGIDFQKEDL